MSFFFTAHSYLRWLVVVVAVVALVRFILVWSGRSQPSSSERSLMSAFVGLLDIQALLGIILIVWLGTAGAGWPRQRFEHAATMLIAIAIAHIFSKKAKNAPGQLRARNYLITLLVVMLLIVAGVMRLPQGWLGTQMPLIGG